MDESFGTIQNQRQIVKWAFAEDTNTNDVKRFEIPNVGHVIAKLKKVTPKGVMSAEEARPMVENILKNKKKAEKIKAKLNGSSLASLATANNSDSTNLYNSALTILFGGVGEPGK